MSFLLRFHRKKDHGNAASRPEKMCIKVSRGRDGLTKRGGCGMGGFLQRCEIANGKEVPLRGNRYAGDRRIFRGSYEGDPWALRWWKFHGPFHETRDLFFFNLLMVGSYVFAIEQK